MGLVTAVLYYNNQGTTTARPVFSLIEVEGTDLDTPAKVAAYLAEMGYGSDVSLGILPADPAELDGDDETTTNSLTVNPATLATTAASASNDLDERRRAVVSSIDALIATAVTASGTAARITLDQRAAYQAHVDALRDAKALVQISANPEGVAIPTLSLPGGTSAATIAQQMPALFDNGSIPLKKTFLKDRGNLLPEFSFDEGDIEYFGQENITGLGFTSESKSGGLAVKFYKASAALQAILDGKVQYATSVRENELYFWRVDFRGDLPGPYTYPGAFSLRIRYYTETGAYLSDGSGALGTWDVTPAYQMRSGQTLAPAGARYATFALVIPTAASAVPGIRVDVVKMWEAIDNAMITDGAATRRAAAHSTTTTGTITTQNDALPSASDTIAESVTPALMDGINVHITASCQHNTTGAGNFILNWWITQQRTGQAETVIAEGILNWGTITGPKPFSVQCNFNPAADGDYTIRLRMARRSTATIPGFTMAHRGISVRQYRA